MSQKKMPWQRVVKLTVYFTVGVVLGRLLGWQCLVGGATVGAAVLADEKLPW